MAVSRQEEIIAALWAICAILSFSSGYEFWGWFFAIKSIADTLCSIAYVKKEIREEKNYRGVSDE